jgi:hypothetical protein
MRKISIKVIVLLFFSITFSTSVYAEDTLNYVRKGYILRLINNDKSLDEEVIINLIDTYFTVFPVLVRNFNENTAREVVYCIDPEYQGVAEVSGKKVRISSRWLKANPDDFDLVTHEVMHIVQAYPSGAGPWWITEGIADYVRYVYGVDNAKGGWYLPNYSDKHNYSDGYRVTARFFLWIENKIKPGSIKQLDYAMRSGVYSDGFWIKQTGMTLDDLWELYGKNPVI